MTERDNSCCCSCISSLFSVALIILACVGLIYLLKL